MTLDDINVMPPGARIKVIGVGGGGGNAVNTMIKSSLDGVDFISCNTDVQALRFSLAEKKIQIGKELTRGLGAGADPDVGREAAIEDREELAKAIMGADMVFITAGMGGGTGTGAASIVAQIAREQGALTVAVVTKPFNFEGKRRRRHAEEGIKRLRESVDTLITIPNQRLLLIGNDDLSMIDAFKMADAVLVNAVRGISDIINIPGTINVDFADVKTVMSSMGQALMGIGRAKGPQRSSEAARMAICSPLLEDIDIEGATGILINITAGTTVRLNEIRAACEIVQEAAHEDANIIFGAVIDETLGEEMRVTVIATGFPAEKDEESDKGSQEKLKRMIGQRPFMNVDEPPPSMSSPILTSSPSTKPDLIFGVALPDLGTTQNNAFPTNQRETHDLAQWTLDQNHIADEKPFDLEISFPFAPAPLDPPSDSFNAFDDDYKETVTKDVEFPLDQKRAGVSIISDPSDDFINSFVNQLSEMMSDANLNDTILLPLDSEQPSTSEYPLEALPCREGATSGSSIAEPLELSSEESRFINDFDKKIDDVLALNDRISAMQNPMCQDDLDIPAFLRHGDPNLTIG